MCSERVQRRLAAILAVDVAGFARLMGEDEEGTLAALKAIRRELGDPKVKEHRGRIVKTTGDGLLVEFASVVDAVRCAVETQREMAERNAGIPPSRRIEFRMGINLGDIMIDELDIYGDGVNVAARLEALAEPGGICVSRAVRDQVRDKLSFSFEDLGELQVKNIARPVHADRIVLDVNSLLSGSPAIAGPVPAPRAISIAQRPSVAVLPFANLSNDPGQDYFVDGMVEEIITALSRIRWLFVVARNSSFTYKGHAADVKQVGRELGVRYVLEGSIRKAGERVRITGQLIDAVSGTHLWAERFDGSLDDIFELQDRVASTVAGVIEPTLQAAEAAYSASRATDSLTAYDLYLRAHAVILSAPAAQIADALRNLERAIESDPRYGPALALAAICCYRLCIDGLSTDFAADRSKGADFARRALQVAADDPGILANAAYALAYFGEDINAMMALADRALGFNPNFARGWFVSGVLRLWSGQPDLAIEHLETSLRLSPRARIGPARAVIGLAQFLARRFEEAVPKLVLAAEEDPNWPNPYRYLAACYARMGRLDEARAIISRLLLLTSVIIPDARYLRDAGQREFYLSALRLAAGEAPQH